MRQRVKRTLFHLLNTRFVRRVYLYEYLCLRKPGRVSLIAWSIVWSGVCVCRDTCREQHMFSSLWFSLGFPKEMAVRNLFIFLQNTEYRIIMPLRALPTPLTPQQRPRRPPFGRGGERIQRTRLRRRGRSPESPRAWTAEAIAKQGGHLDLRTDTHARRGDARAVLPNRVGVLSNPSLPLIHVSARRPRRS